ncbi:4-hydroxybenzoate polyprenyltransferase [Malassezia sp. CBS 17886]|nr:4-hydroxybenzoate polyprenyltransferase [Malassezia sp. CBS 17886]
MASAHAGVWGVSRLRAAPPMPRVRLVSTKQGAGGDRPFSPGMPTPRADDCVHQPVKKPFRIAPYLALARWDRPIGSWLLYLPCTWSITMACQYTGAPVSVWLSNLAVFGVGSVVMRGAGCTINDMWDRKIDAKVERTKTRPLAAGDVTQREATAFLGLQLLVGLGILGTLNWYSIALGACSVLPVMIYPLMKRVTHWPHVVLGATFTWGSMLGWSAVAGACYWPAVLPLYTGTTIWCVAYDTIYAHQDKVDDAKAGVKSSALYLGNKYTKPALTAMSLAWMLLVAYAVHEMSPLTAPLSLLSDGAPGFQAWLHRTLATGHPFFLTSWLTAVAHVAWQIRTVQLDNRTDCWRKFSSNRTVGIIIFAGLAADYLYQKSLTQKDEKSAHT